jgi:hypothetical protein
MQDLNIKNSWLKASRSNDTSTNYFYFIIQLLKGNDAEVLVINHDIKHSW